MRIHFHFHREARPCLNNPTHIAVPFVAASSTQNGVMSAVYSVLSACTVTA